MKDVMEILNKVKIDLNDYVIEDLSEIEKANLKKSVKGQIKKNKYGKYKFGKQALAACLVLGMLGVGGGVVIAGINVLGYDFEYLFGVDEDSFKDYKTIVNEIIYDEGIHVKLNEVMIDNNELIVNATFQFDEPPFQNVEGSHIRPIASIYINGKKIENGGHGLIEKITDTQFIFNTGYSINTEDLTSDNMHVKIVFFNIRTGDDVFRGKWEFEFNISREQLLNDLERYNIDSSFTIHEEQKVDILNIELTKIATDINFKTDNTKYEVEFKLEDDLGNIYLPQNLSISYGEENIGYERFQTINPSATKLIITPYFVLAPTTSGRGPSLDEYTLLTEQQLIIDLKN